MHPFCQGPLLLNLTYGKIDKFRVKKYFGACNKPFAHLASACKTLLPDAKMRGYVPRGLGDQNRMLGG